VTQSLAEGGPHKLTLIDDGAAPVTAPDSRTASDDVVQQFQTLSSRVSSLEFRVLTRNRNSKPDPTLFTNTDLNHNPSTTTR